MERAHGTDAVISTLTEDLRIDLNQSVSIPRAPRRRAANRWEPSKANGEFEPTLGHFDPGQSIPARTLQKSAL